MDNTHNLMNILIANSSFKQNVTEIAEFISKIYQVRDVLNNEMLADQKKIQFFSGVVDGIEDLKAKYGLKAEGIFSFFNQFLSGVDDDSLKDQLQAMLMEKTLIVKPGS